MEGGEVKAVSISNGFKGAVSSKVFGIIKQDWKLLQAGSEIEKKPASMAFDANVKTWWQSEEGSGPHFIAIDLGKAYKLKGFAYTPQAQHAEGMMAKGIIQVSADGKIWQDASQFDFGNLVNDPSTRNHYFKNPTSARYIRIAASEIAGNGKSLAIAELDFFEN